MDIKDTLLCLAGAPSRSVTRLTRTAPCAPPPRRLAWARSPTYPPWCTLTTTCRARAALAPDCHALARPPPGLPAGSGCTHFGPPHGGRHKLRARADGVSMVSTGAQLAVFFAIVAIINALFGIFGDVRLPVASTAPRCRLDSLLPPPPCVNLETACVRMCSCACVRMRGGRRVCIATHDTCRVSALPRVLGTGVQQHGAGVLQPRLPVRAPLPRYAALPRGREKSLPPLAHHPHTRRHCGPAICQPREDRSRPMRTLPRE